jgi:hypothetical protein
LYEHITDGFIQLSLATLVVLEQLAMKAAAGPGHRQILDRRLHYATTLNIKGESYRLKEKRRAGLLGKTTIALSEQQEVAAGCFTTRIPEG